MSDYKSISGETLSKIPTLAAMAKAELSHLPPSIMARMEIGLKACDGIESLITLLIESGMIATCKQAISEVISCETCYYNELCEIAKRLDTISGFCSDWKPINGKE